MNRFIQAHGHGLARAKQGYAYLSVYSSNKFGIRALPPGAGASRLIVLYQVSLPSAPVLFASEVFQFWNLARTHYRQRLFSRTRQDSVVYASWLSALSRYSSNTHQGAALWPLAGGGVEDQVRMILFPWSYRVAHRRCGASLLPRFKGIPSSYGPVGEYLGSLPVGSVPLTRVIDQHTERSVLRLKVPLLCTTGSL
jgi:hypothetical protein